MEHKDWCNSRATCVCDNPAICERAWNAALKYNKVVAKTAYNTGSPKLRENTMEICHTAPNNARDETVRDCTTCEFSCSDQFIILCKSHGFNGWVLRTASPVAKTQHTHAAQNAQIRASGVRETLYAMHHRRY